MITIGVDGFESWRAAARRAIASGVPPDDILWADTGTPQSWLSIGEEDPALKNPPPGDVTGGALTVPRAFLRIAVLVACHRKPEKWPRLYRVLWRIANGEREVLDVASDPDVHALTALAAQVRRDEHKMRAFVRFTPLRDDEGERYVAWYAPDHLIVPMAAPFFADRYASMRWSILTPDISAHWDGRQLTFCEGVPAPPTAGDDAVKELWRTYYASVFNPARVNVSAMMREMPARRWSRLPEAQAIPALLHSAHERTVSLGHAVQESARPFVPQGAGLDALREAAGSCRGCDLYERATRVVFGEGRAAARLVLVGEQPGDAEDRIGRPFIGPAGQVLDRALNEARIDRATLYVTNAVKHFSFEERGKHRIHKTPRASEIRACRPWLEAELQALRPACVVCLGATAATALLGPQARVMQMRGRVIANTAWAPSVVITVHPSAVLRAEDGERYFEMLVADLRLAAGVIG